MQFPMVVDSIDGVAKQQHAPFSDPTRFLVVRRTPIADVFVVSARTDCGGAAVATAFVVIIGTRILLVQNIHARKQVIDPPIPR